MVCSNLTISEDWHESLMVCGVIFFVYENNRPLEIADVAKLITTQSVVRSTPEKKEYIFIIVDDTVIVPRWAYLKISF